jgi:hypothetical protein
MVSLKSNESAAGEAAGGPWRVRDFLSFVWKTYQKRDVADVSQICPIASFGENWDRTCRAGGRGTRLLQRCPLEASLLLEKWQRQCHVHPKQRLLRCTHWSLFMHVVVVLC